MRLAGFVISATLSMSAWGNCTVDDERRHLPVHAPGSGEEHVACKEDPELHSEIRAVAAPRDPSEDAAKDDYDLDVTLQDRASGKPVARGHFKGLLANGGGPELGESVKTNEHRLKYDGSKYIVPHDMQEVDCRVC